MQVYTHFFYAWFNGIALECSTAKFTLYSLLLGLGLKNIIYTCLPYLMISFLFYNYITIRLTVWTHFRLRLTTMNWTVLPMPSFFLSFVLLEIGSKLCNKPTYDSIRFFIFIIVYLSSLVLLCFFFFFFNFNSLLQQDDFIQ